MANSIFTQTIDFTKIGDVSARHKTQLWLIQNICIVESHKFDISGLTGCKKLSGQNENGRKHPGMDHFSDFSRFMVDYSPHTSIK